MSVMAVDIAKMVDMLPESDQRFAYEFVKKLVLAWDPDFTKVTPDEYKQIKEAENGEFFSDNEIDWDHLEKYVQ